MTVAAPWRPLAIRTRLTLWYTGVLLAILVVVSALAYSMLRWSLTEDLDQSLVTVAQVVRDAGYAAPDEAISSTAEAAVRDILGPEFYDKFFQLTDPEGHPRAQSTQLPTTPLPLSARARANASRGARTFETVQLANGESVRLLTMPVITHGQLGQLVQVGMSMQRANQVLRRYLETLLVLIPLGLVLAAGGGALIARASLAQLDAMSRTARRISAEDLSQRLSRRGTDDELDRLADTLNDMLARLESAFTEIRRFAADAAHELRTPLTALKGGIEVTLRAERPAAGYRDVLRSSLEEVERLIRLAEDLLLLTRASTGAGPARARVELEPVVLEVGEIALGLAQQRGVALRVKEIMPCAVTGDELALRRAVRNLVENAIKYTPSGGLVEITLRSADHEAVITVRDTGIGIAGPDVDRIFEPFVRLDAARARDSGGAGLGLAIVRSVVTAHGGRVSVESAPGVGSVFTIRLPLA